MACVINIPNNLRDNLAIIANGHGKSIDDSLVFYPRKEKATVLKLVSILRIADALDHKHNLDVSLEKVEIKDNTLIIHIKVSSSNIISKTFNILINVKCT